MKNSEMLKILEKQDGHNVRHFLALTALFGVPRSYLDVGCGTGITVKLARALGTDAYGVDIIPNTDVRIFKHDLNNLFYLSEVGAGPVELITCLEVAEHLREDADKILATTLSRNLLPGGFLIFSSAYPGQAGNGHINKYPSYYWRDLFDKHEMSYQDDLTMRLVIMWSHMLSPLMWLPANVQVFQKNAEGA